MRRLIKGRAERGSTTIVVAVSFLVLLTIVGLSVDVGAAFAKRQEAQNGADAAALAVASQCVLNKQAQDCAGDLDAANEIALLNERTDDSAVVTEADIKYHTPAPFHVTVTVSAEQRAWFLPGATDTDSFTVRRSATVNYGSPLAGTTLPVLFPSCLFPAGPDGSGPPFGTPVEMWLPKGNYVPGQGNCDTSGYPSGGFGWIEDPDVPTVNCSLYVDISEPIKSKPGISLPTGCSNQTIAQLIGSVVLIPLFDFSQYNGNGGQYIADRFAAVKLTGYSEQTGNFNPLPAPPGCQGPRPDWASKACFRAEFQEFITDPGDFELGGPLTDITLVRLTG